MRTWALATHARFAPDLLDLQQNALRLGIVEAAECPAEASLSNRDELLGIPGIVDVVTAEDRLPNPYTTAGQPEPEPSVYDTFLINPVVRYIGEPVAFVAAETKAALAEALALSQVNYRPVTGALHSRCPDNLVDRWQHSHGEARPGTDVYITRAKVPRVSHVQLEPHAAMAYPDSEGRIVIVTTTQVPFHVRRIVARALGLPVSHVIVRATDVGGGFGGKQEVIIEPWVAWLARRTGRPVKLMLSRRQEFVLGRTRHAAELRVKSVWNGLSLEQLDLDATVTTGPYASHGTTVAHNMGLKTLPLYQARSYRFGAQILYAPGPVAGAFRGYGGPQGAMAVETHINAVAAEKGVGAYELRQHILARTGHPLDLFPSPDTNWPIRFHHNEPRRLMRKVVKHSREILGPLRPDEGLGLALSLQASGVPHSELAEVLLGVDEDGSLWAKTGAIDMGQGSRETLSAIVRQTLGVSEAVPIRWSMGTTGEGGFDYGSYASSTTYVTGLAAQQAARDIKRQMTALYRKLARTETLPPLNFGNLPLWRQLAWQSFYGRFRSPLGARGIAAPHDSPAPIAVCAVRLTVDPQLLQVNIRHITLGVDVGRVINPPGLRGQIEGAVVQGLGYALCESLEVDQNHHVTTTSLFDYGLISPAALPPLDILIEDSREHSGPAGAKSAGEVALGAIAPAVVHAVHQATGAWITELPVTPRRLWHALNPEKTSSAVPALVTDSRA